MTDTARNRGRGAAGVAELDDANVQDWEPEVALPDFGGPDRAWSGQRTRLRTAYPLMRDQQILKPGDTFEVAASYDRATKRWVGPEAVHVEHLFAVGQIAGSQEAETRLRLQSAIEHERGVHPTRDDPLGRPDLASFSADQVVNQWRRVLGGGQGELSRTERQNARSGDASVDALALQLATLLQGAAQHAGSSAPGTAVVDA